MSKGTRRKAGKRDKSHRLAKATTRAERKVQPNDRVVQRLEMFRHKQILGGKAQWIDVFDGIGQLHAVGMLDGHGLDGKLLREAGREYIGLYNYTWIALSAKSSDLARGYGGKSNLDDTARDFRFASLDALLPRCSAERYWTHAILLDHFGLDTVHPLVDRLVNFKMAQWRIPTVGNEDRDLRVAGDTDFELLGHALRGLFALADGAMPERWRGTTWIRRAA